MITRLFFALVTIFWIVMNVLLWQAEYGNAQRITKVPVSLVVGKILNCPDISALSITEKGKPLGTLKWNVALTDKNEEGSIQTTLNEPVEGMVREPLRYLAECDGNIFIRSLAQRVRFNGALMLETNRSWIDLNLRMTMRPYHMVLHADAAKKEVAILGEDGNQSIGKTFTFQQLQNPSHILKELGFDEFTALLATTSLPLPKNPQTVSGGLKWEAYYDYIKIGKEPLKVFRLQAHVLDRLDIVIWVGRMGEILQIHLPNGWKLENDRINPLG